MRFDWSVTSECKCCLSSYRETSILDVMCEWTFMIVNVVSVLCCVVLWILDLVLLVVLHSRSDHHED